MESSKGFDRIDLVKLGCLALLVVLCLGAASITAYQQGILARGKGAVATLAVAQVTEKVDEGVASALETAIPTLEGVLPSQPGEVELPALPESIPGLSYNPDDGFVYNELGVRIFVLNKETQEWVPVTPEEILAITGNQIPQKDINGYWVLVGTDGNPMYQWDENSLTWVFLAVTAEPGAGAGVEAGAEQPATGTEVGAGTGAESGSTTEQGSSGTGTTTEPGAGTGAEAGAPPAIQPGPIPESLLVVPKSYTLRAGEFAYCLARRFDVNPYTMLYMNGFRVNSILLGGTKLAIPQGGGSFPEARALIAHPAEYTVEKGDTIYTIACKFGDVFPEAIAYANNLSAPYSMTVGQVLYIP